MPRVASLPTALSATRSAGSSRRPGALSSRSLRWSHWRS